MKKELTVDAKELSEFDPATQVVETPEVPEPEVKGTLVEHYGDSLPEEVKQSGIAIGFQSGSDEHGVSGVAGEDDERAKTPQAESQ